MNKVSTRLFIIGLVLACFIMLSGTPALADDGFGIDGSVTVNAVLDHITVTPVNPSITLVSGDTPTLQFTATANYSNAPTAIVTSSANWTSLNPSVATIDMNTGLATILTAGSTNISATFGVKMDDTTLTVSAETSDTTSGGGGGGGGATGVTSLAEYMTGDGRVITSATAESIDGKVKLDIPRGTIVKNRNGQRLYSISIKPSSTPSTPPDDYKFVCLTYDIGPSGATFNPPIHLTFKYNYLQVPAGVAEESLVIATLQDGKWIEFEGCVVDKINNTITVPISHFTTFTVMAHTAAASFEITGITVNPDEVYPYEIVTVSVTITNTGGLAGSYNVILKINDLELQTRRVTLGVGKSEIISFKVTPNTAGEATVDVNGLSGKFKVNKPVPKGRVAEVLVSPAPASFIISDLSITPDEVMRFEKVTIAALVSNTGGTKGSYTIILKIDDKEEARKRVILDAGKNEKVSFSITNDITGSHIIDINGNTGQFTVHLLTPLPKPVGALPFQPSTNWWRFGGIIAGLVIIVGILMFFFRRLA